VTKFADGGDLYEYCIQQTSLIGEQRSQFIFKQLLNGVHDIHRRGLVHRDLKDQNIFCCDSLPYPRIRIGDFGYVKRLEPDQLAVERVGTFAFMAPEVLKKEASGHKADVWSLGVMLHTLVSSQLPFQVGESIVDQ
jgi:serine/threonine protein kinase